MSELSVVDAVALGLSTFYLAFSLARTHGPFNAFKAFRDRWPIGGLVTCVYCLSVWVALIMWALLQVYPPAVYIIAAAGASSAFYRYTGADVTT